MTDYAHALHATKSRYPFPRWAASGLEPYTEDACAAFSHVFDRLIDDLVALGPDADEATKLAAFERAILVTNDLDEEAGLIETGEREDLCELTNAIAVAAGMDPTRYGGGEGPASEWREW